MISEYEDSQHYTGKFCNLSQKNKKQKGREKKREKERERAGGKSQGPPLRPVTMQHSRVLYKRVDLGQSFDL